MWVKKGADMSKRIHKEVSRIECEDDAGNRYTVVAYDVYVAATTLSGKRGETKVSNGFELLGGGRVDWFDADRFQVFGTNVVIRKIR